MCGILGYYTNHDTMTEEKGRIIRDATIGLMMASVERGKDASGIAYLDESMNVNILKRPIEGTKLVQEKEFKRVFEDLENVPRVLIGHTRKGTIGSEKDNNNNHPLYSKDSHWTIVHNGSVEDKNELATRDGQVDSEVILRNIEAEDVDEDVSPIDAVTAGGNKTVGKFAVAAFRGGLDNLYIFRNDLTSASKTLQKTIYLMYIPEIETMFFASEDWMLLNNVGTTYHKGFFRDNMFSKRMLRRVENNMLLELSINEEGMIDMAFDEVKSATYITKTTTHRNNHNYGHNNRGTSYQNQSNRNKNNNKSNKNRWKDSKDDDKSSDEVLKVRKLVAEGDIPSFDKIPEKVISKFNWTPEDAFGKNHKCACENTVYTDDLSDQGSVYLCVVCGKVYENAHKLMNKVSDIAIDGKKLAYQRVLVFNACERAEEEILLGINSPK